MICHHILFGWVKTVPASGLSGTSIGLLLCLTVA